MERCCQCLKCYLLRLYQIITDNGKFVLIQHKLLFYKKDNSSPKDHALRHRRLNKHSTNADKEHQDSEQISADHTKNSPG